MASTLNFFSQTHNCWVVCTTRLVPTCSSFKLGFCYYYDCYYYYFPIVNFFLPFSMLLYKMIGCIRVYNFILFSFILLPQYSPSTSQLLTYWLLSHFKVFPPLLILCHLHFIIVSFSSPFPYILSAKGWDVNMLSLW